VLIAVVIGVFSWYATNSGDNGGGESGDNSLLDLNAETRALYGDVPAFRRHLSGSRENRSFFLH
jgi:hypothetical protein